MKRIEAVSPSLVSNLKTGKRVAGAGLKHKKPAGPVTYSVSKGADVFWPGKSGRKVG